MKSVVGREASVYASFELGDDSSLYTLEVKVRKGEGTLSNKY